MGVKLIVDRVKCIESSEVRDELYFLVMRLDADCDVLRVGPLTAWNNIDDGDERNADVVLVDNFRPGTYLVALMEEDDSYDYDADLRTELSKAMRVLFASQSILEKDQGRLMAEMLNYFANIVSKKSTNDDLLGVSPVSGAGTQHFVGDGARYDISFKMG